MDAIPLWNLFVLFWIDICCIVSHVPQMTQMVKGLNWTDSEITYFVEKFVFVILYS